MKWSQLVWWVFWRGLLCGAIQGLLFGTAVDRGFGIIFGTVIGGFLGAILGLINGSSLTNIVRDDFTAPYNQAPYIRSIRYASIPLNFLVVLACSFLFVGLLAFIPALIATTDAYYFSGGFVRYADSLLKDKPSRNAPANVLS
jgi:hypothetical protein